MDLQRRVLIDKEIRELSEKFINDRNFLEEDNRNIRKEIDEMRLKHGSAEDLAESTQ